MNIAVIGALVLLLGACQEPAQEPGLVRSSDPELAARVSQLLPPLAERAGLSLTESVRVERRSRAELEEFLETRLDEELPPPRAEALRDAYALLGLVPRQLDIRELLLSVYGEQVSGFYDPPSGALYVLEDQPEQMLETVLVHELVHAVQDQTTDLDRITDRDRGNDRQLAAQAAIEGHATLVMFEHLMNAQGLPMDLAEVPDFAGTIRPALESMRDQFPALASAPPIFQESLLFPYLEGSGFVQALWRAQEGRPAPFDSLLPASTEQVLEPSRFLSVPRDAPTEVVLELPPEWDLVYENTLGALETGILVAARVGPEGEASRSGWDGDRFALLEADGRQALAWVSVWDDEAARDRFVSTLGSGLDGFEGDASLDSITVDGRPAALLTVGGAPIPAVRLVGGVP